jgi:hypothetical protein
MPDKPPIMRVGRTLSQCGPSAPCTIYRVVPGDDRKADEWIGVAFTTEIAEAICAAVNARGIPLLGDDDLPSASQIRAWLVAHNWTCGAPVGTSGRAGTLWYPPDGAQAVGIPRDDSDPFLTAGALERIASRSHLSVESLAREMRRMLHG